MNFASLWGSWFGVAGGVMLGLEDDKLLAATLLGGNAGLVGTAILAPGWNTSRSRARLVSIAGVIGGLAGAGIDLVAQPDDEKVAVGIPLLTSVIGLAIGVRATRDHDKGLPVERAARGNGALVGLSSGRLWLDAPSLTPALVPWEGPDGVAWRPAVKLQLFRATF